MSTNRYTLDGKNAGLVDKYATKLLYVTSAKYGGDWNSMMHAHACTELFYVVGGRGRFKIEEIELPVTVDDMVVVNPNVKHTELGDGSRPLEYIVLGVEGLEFSPVGEGDSRYCRVNFQASREAVLHSLRSMLREITSKGPGYELICQDFLEILLVLLMRRNGFSFTPTTGRHSGNECALVRRYIDEHFKESISLDQLAELAHLNKYYMVHSFSKEYGISPINYLISCRIKESRYLLTDTDHSLSQISHMLGFSSPSYFSQSFRRLEGVSPMEFRKSSRLRTDSHPPAPSPAPSHHGGA